MIEWLTCISHISWLYFKVFVYEKCLIGLNFKISSPLSQFIIYSISTRILIFDLIQKLVSSDPLKVSNRRFKSFKIRLPWFTAPKIGSGDYYIWHYGYDRCHQSTFCKHYLGKTPATESWLFWLLRRGV